MRVYSLAIGKGGTGKSSLSVNLAYLSSLSVNEGKRVLLIDLDNQANSSFIFPQSPYSSYDLLTSKVDINDCIIETQYENLDIISADFRLISIRNLEDNVLNKKILKLNDVYDYVFIDTPPSLNEIVENAVIASDTVIVPTILDVYGFLGVKNVYDLMRDVKPYINILIVPNLKIHNSVLHENIYEQLLEFAGNNNIKVAEPLPQSVEMSNSTAQNKILSEIKINNKLKSAIKHLFMKEIKVYE